MRETIESSVRSLKDEVMEEKDENIDRFNRIYYYLNMIMDRIEKLEQK